MKTSKEKPTDKQEISEAERFDEALRKILTVSHEELKRREEEWKQERKSKGYKRVRS
jgi:hypothetical protein